MTPPPKRDSAQWATAARIMPPSAPIPGPFNAARTPYINPIAQAVANASYNRITAVMGTQMGKSVGFENIVGWRMDDDPVPILYVAPTSSMIDSTIEPKFMDLINQCASLKKKFDVKRSTKYVKWLGGVKFRFAWAGSASELAADSAGLVLVDEVDRIVNTSEGDTTEVIEARGDAYDDSKIIYTATPTLGKVSKQRHPETGFEHWALSPVEKLGSKVWQLWQSGTRHEWAVPCPHCGEYFIPWSGLLHWPGRGGEAFVDPTFAEKNATLTCPNHGCSIVNKYRQQMNRKARPVAPGERVEKDGRISGEASTAGNSHFTFAVSGMFSFSAKKSLGYCAKRLAAVENSGDPAGLMGVYNTVFGECFGLTGEAPAWEAVKAMAWKYDSEDILGAPVKLLATVDVQKNRLVWVVRAWYHKLGSALVECGVEWGDTLRPDVWADLAVILNKEWGGLGIAMMGIDCGYRDDMVFNFVHEHKARTRAMRGGSLDRAYRAVKVETNNKGKVRKKGDVRWEFDSSRGKTWVHSRIGWSVQKPGFWLLPDDIDEGYCKEIVGEEFNEQKNEWVVLGENHYLDCEAMQYMLARMLGLHQLKGTTTLDDLTANEAVENDALPPEKVTPTENNAAPVDSWLANYQTDEWV